MVITQSKSSPFKRVEEDYEKVIKFENTNRKLNEFSKMLKTRTNRMFNPGCLTDQLQEILKDRGKQLRKDWSNSNPSLPWKSVVECNYL